MVFSGSGGVELGYTGRDGRDSRDSRELATLEAKMLVNSLAYNSLVYGSTLRKAVGGVDLMVRSAHRR